MTEYDNRASQESRARHMLVRVTPFSNWAKNKRQTSKMVRLWLAVVHETMKLAALTQDEERLVKNVLELDDATAIVEASHVDA